MIKPYLYPIIVILLCLPVWSHDRASASLHCTCTGGGLGQLTNSQTHRSRAANAPQQPAPTPQPTAPILADGDEPSTSPRLMNILALMGILPLVVVLLAVRLSGQQNRPRT